ncbi:MAG: AAA family ATPase [SAR324 cluster bacterium]|nr:AAA family ATPase [SAR324 cluster bacterium]
MILLFGGEKGGVGKSTLATTIAGMLSLQGRDVILIDTDRQPTSANWVERRNEDSDLSDINCVQLYGKGISKQIIALAERCENVIIDAGGRDSIELRASMVVADKLFIPLKPSQADAETVPKLSEIIETAQTFNPDLIAKVVITMASANPIVKEYLELQAVLQDFSNIELVETIICDRKIYRDALKIGRTVKEMFPQNRKASTEVDELFLEVLK